MKKYPFFYSKIVAILFLGIIFLCGCVDKNYYGPDQYTVEFDIYPEDWLWSDLYYRWECSRDIRGLTPEVVANSTITGGVYIEEDFYDQHGNVVAAMALKPLPFVHTWGNPGNNDIFTENISFDASQGLIYFYVQNSTLERINPYQNVYKFKITVIR